MLTIARLVGKLAFDAVEARMLEDENRVGVLERGPEHSPCVFEGSGGEDFDTGDVSVPPFEAVRMLSGELLAAAGSHSDDERDVELATRHVEVRGGGIQDLVRGEKAEIHGHDLDDGAHAAERRADARPHENRLRQRSIADPLGAELLEKSLRDGEAPAVSSHVLPHEKDSRVFRQRFADCLAHRLPIGESAGHDRASGGME